MFLSKVLSETQHRRQDYWAEDKPVARLKKEVLQLIHSR